MLAAFMIRVGIVSTKKAIIVTALHDTEGSALPHNVSLPVRIIFILHSIALVHEVHLPREATCVVELFCVRLTPERLNADDVDASTDRTRSEIPFALGMVWISMSSGVRICWP